MDFRTRRPSPSLMVSFVALAVAISGTAVALPGKNTVKTNDIKNNAVTSKKIKDLAITASKLANGSVSGDAIADDAIGDDKLSEIEVIGGSFIRATATDGADEAAARAAAPEIALFQRGQLDLYAKCFRNAGADETRVEVYARTSVNGSILDGQDNLPGGPAATDFLNPATLELDRQLDTEDIAGNDASYNENEFTVASPDGTGLHGQLGLGVKNGNLGAGNGLYGDGNVCLIQGTVFG